MVTILKPILFICLFFASFLKACSTAFLHINPKISLQVFTTLSQLHLFNNISSLFLIANQTELQENLIHANNRHFRTPYISENAFRAWCNFAFDKLDNTIYFKEIETKNTIPNNSENPILGPFSSYLQDDKIIAWLRQNVSVITRNQKYYYVSLNKLFKG